MSGYFCYISSNLIKHVPGCKQKFPVLDHGLALNLQPLRVKLTRFYFLNEGKIKPRVNTNSMKCTLKELFIQSELP